MRRRQAVSLTLLALGLLLSSNACQSPRLMTPLATPPPSAGTGAKAPVRIQVMSNGWHSDIVLARSAALARAVPEIADFPQALHFSFGWGDAAYYQAPDPGLVMGLGAAFVPTPAVVHMVALRRHPATPYVKELLRRGLGEAIP